MATFSEQLRFETARRDAALLALNSHSKAGAGIIVDVVNQSRSLVRHEIESSKAFITEKIQETRQAVHCEIDHVKDSVKIQIDELAARLDPTKIILAHPWASVAGAVATGAAIVPLIKTIYNAPQETPIAVTTHVKPAPECKEVSNESPWTILKHSILASLPELALTLFKRQMNQR
jgi:hypothetical protein